MVSYGYNNRGHNTYHEMEPQSESWSKPSYDGYRSSNHVHQPIIVDAEGRRRPVTGYDPNNSDGYATRIDRTFGGWNKPNGLNSTIGDDRFDDYYRINEAARGPYGVKTYGWDNRPIGHSGWTKPPSHEAPFLGPTNDIGSAMEILKHAALSENNQRSRFTLPGSTMGKRDAYMETIDSREAPKRYGNFNFVSRPFKASENYSGIVNSREAARKYHGSWE